MTDAQKAYLHALADMRSWHRWQIAVARSAIRAHGGEVRLLNRGEGISAEVALPALKEGSRDGANGLQDIGRLVTRLDANYTLSRLRPQ